eukprot:TRINITY_DN14798_c0_g1_i1.p1 TRINITY_DN14798_c0_g1~~TRINITY_DN14798_c0_g1_i1.p1  ORF type:complete len:335 (-),score=53.42 TRINITY_DN14798_c0_g1_i1:62-1066(-)
MTPHSLLLVLLVSVAMVVSTLTPSVAGTSSVGTTVFYSFNATSAVNRTISVSPDTSNIYQVSWGYGFRVVNATYALLYPALYIDHSEVGGPDDIWTSSLTELFFGTLDPCVVNRGNFKTASFAINASTNANSGLLVQSLSIYPMPVVFPSGSAAAPQVTSFEVDSASDYEVTLFTYGAYFGLNITDLSTRYKKYIVTVDISLSNNTVVSQLISTAQIAGNGTCTTNFDNSTIGLNYFTFDLSQINTTSTTVQFTISPEMGGLWYLNLQYKYPSLSPQVTVTVSMTVNGGDIPVGGLISAIVGGVVVAVAVVAFVVVVIVRRRRRSHYEPILSKS